MPMTAQTLCLRACETAKIPGYIVRAGERLNLILTELCQDYDLVVTRKVASFVLNNNQGPYPLPTDWMRANRNDVFYVISGVPYVLINVNLAEYDRLVQQAGISNFPDTYTTDMSVSPPVMFVWPPSSGAYPMTARYQSLMPEIVAPESSQTVPWFPNQTYLLTRLTGEMMQVANDDRADAFLGDGPAGARGILQRFLKLPDDDEDRVKTVTLDRRRFGRSFDSLKNTKQIGW